MVMDSGFSFFNGADDRGKDKVDTGGNAWSFKKFQTDTIQKQQAHQQEQEIVSSLDDKILEMR